MSHPLHSLALLDTRARIRSAIGPCVDLDPEDHADLITDTVLRVRLSRTPYEDLRARARQHAHANGADGLQAKGV